MISTTLSGATTLFNYNGDGVRLKQVIAGMPTTYTQDIEAPLPVVLQAKTATTTTQYLFSNSTHPIAQYTSSAWQYLLPDGLGSVRQIADANGNVLLSEGYEPYGKLLSSSGSATSIFGYAGEEFDTTGLIYLRARYLQPTLGIFTSCDPWSGDEMRPGSMNGFGYVEGNPVNRIDPSGQWALDWGGNIWAVRESNDDWNSLFRALGIPREAVPYSDLGPVPSRFNLDSFVDPLIRATAALAQGQTLPPPPLADPSASINCYPTALSCAGGRCIAAWIGDFKEADTFLKNNSQLVARNEVHYGDIFRIGGYFQSPDGTYADENFAFHYGLVILKSEQTGRIWTFNGGPSSDPWVPGYRIATLEEVIGHFDYASQSFLGWLASIGHNRPAVRGTAGQLDVFYRLNILGDVVQAMRAAIKSLKVY